LERKSWYILWPFEIYITDNLYISWHFGNLVAIWYIFYRFGILCKEKSGSPGDQASGCVEWID
jgi:hypothetical protein